MNGSLEETCDVWVRHNDYAGIESIQIYDRDEIDMSCEFMGKKSRSNEMQDIGWWIGHLTGNLGSMWVYNGLIWVNI
jgi:hypothetical protein